MTFFGYMRMRTRTCIILLVAVSGSTIVAGAATTPKEINESLHAANRDDTKLEVEVNTNSQGERNGKGLFKDAGNAVKYTINAVRDCVNTAGVEGCAHRAATGFANAVSDKISDGIDTVSGAANYFKDGVKDVIGIGDTGDKDFIGIGGAGDTDTDTIINPSTDSTVLTTTPITVPVVQETTRVPVTTSPAVSSTVKYIAIGLAVGIMVFAIVVAVAVIFHRKKNKTTIGQGGRRGSAHVSENSLYGATIGGAQRRGSAHDSENSLYGAVN
ncbi:unnamed protein product [Meganyctiphanes norvegica]|uniref:Mid2 domain-containing protein n=1 Tax=Meganyctiphanes norvegica TaxID=48144 RepID=A0AAV2PPI8_MEGNR